MCLPSGIEKSIIQGEKLMATKPGHIAYAVLLSVSLASCASNLSEGFSYDYASAEVSDFNGEWFGKVDCKYASGYLIPVAVRISNGVGELSSFSNPGKKQTADLDLQDGKIKWTGNFTKISGNSGLFSLNGQWREKQFRVQGRRGTFACSGELKRHGT